MKFNFDAIFHMEKSYPKHLARNCPCKICEFGTEDKLFWFESTECDNCTKYILWTVDCICKLGEMERKYEVD